jgi:nitrous oxidase accessory protein NosD
VAAVALVLAFAGSAATYVVRLPPVVHLGAGVHQGPLVIDRREVLEGEPGAVVRGGIVVTSDDVTVRDVRVVGGETGIDVRDSENVVLDGVLVRGASLDGISARQSSLRIEDCQIEMPAAPYTQGIDISFAGHLAPSVVDGCTVTGGAEGIVSHMAMVSFRENHVSGTGLRAIAVTEMSMGRVAGNRIEGARGVGIYCGDYSRCTISGNQVAGTHADPESDDGTRAGFAIQSHFGSHAVVKGNVVDAPIAAFHDATLVRR